MKKDKKYNKDHEEKGWTFVETLIVIAIGMILTGSIGFTALRFIDKAKIVNVRTAIEHLSLALNSYFIDCKVFPTEEQGLESLHEKPILSPVPDDWDGPYLSKDLGDDPWGNPYVYSIPGPKGLPFAISSLGADGMEGGEKNDKDINSWEN